MCVRRTTLQGGEIPAIAPIDAAKERNGAVSRSPVYQVPQHVDAGGPRIRVYGTMEYGRLRIRHKGR
jgi:hypothetical protein